MTHAQMVEVVQRSITDGEVCDWVKHNFKKTAADKAALLANMLELSQSRRCRGILPAQDAQKSRRTSSTATTSRTLWILLTRTRSGCEWLGVTISQSGRTLIRREPKGSRLIAFPLLVYLCRDADPYRAYFHNPVQKQGLTAARTVLRSGHSTV